MGSLGPLPADDLMPERRARIRELVLPVARRRVAGSVSDKVALRSWLKRMKAFKREWVDPFRPPAPPPLATPAVPVPAGGVAFPPGFREAFEHALPALLQACQHHPLCGELVSHVFFTALRLWPTFVPHSEEATDHWFLTLLNTAMAHPADLHPRQNAGPLPVGYDAAEVRHRTATLTNQLGSDSRARLRERVVALHALFPPPFDTSDLLCGLGRFASLQLTFLADTLEAVLLLKVGRSRRHAVWAGWCLSGYDPARVEAEYGIPRADFPVTKHRTLKAARARLTELWLSLPGGHHDCDPE